MHQVSVVVKKWISRNTLLQSLWDNLSCSASWHCRWPETYLLVAKFCYGARIDVTAEKWKRSEPQMCSRVSPNEWKLKEMQISSTSTRFSSMTTFSQTGMIQSKPWKLRALPLAEELHIVARCIAAFWHQGFLCRQHKFVQLATLRTRRNYKFGGF